MLFGLSVVGNTHLVFAITMAVFVQGQACRFFSATALVQLLQQAKASFELPALIQKLDCYALLVICVISQVHRSELESSVLFELVLHCHIVAIKGQSIWQKATAACFLRSDRPTCVIDADAIAVTINSITLQPRRIKAVTGKLRHRPSDLRRTHNLIDATRQPGHDHDPNCNLRNQQSSKQTLLAVNQIAGTPQPD